MEIEKHKTTIETATGQELTFDYIVNNNVIEDTLLSLAEQQNIDLQKCPLNPWKALLEEVGAILWSNRDILKKVHPISPNLHKIYDLYKINKVCDIYIHLSKKYNKLVSVISFSCLLYMDCTNLYSLLNDSQHLQGGEEFNTIRKQIYKKIYINREENIKDKCFEVSSPVGVIALANHEYGWNGNGNGNLDGANNKTLSISTLPQLNAIESH